MKLIRSRSEARYDQHVGGAATEPNRASNRAIDKTDKRTNTRSVRSRACRERERERERETGSIRLAVGAFFGAAG